MQTAVGVFSKDPIELDADWTETPDAFSGIYSELMKSMFSSEHLQSDSSLFSDKYAPTAIEAMHGVLEEHMGASLDTQLHRLPYGCRVFTVGISHKREREEW